MAESATPERKITVESLLIDGNSPSATTIPTSETLTAPQTIATDTTSHWSDTSIASSSPSGGISKLRKNRLDAVLGSESLTKTFEGDSIAEEYIRQITLPQLQELQSTPRERMPDGAKWADDQFSKAVADQIQPTGHDARIFCVNVQNLRSGQFSYLAQDKVRPRKGKRMDCKPHKLLAEYHN